MPDLSAQNPQEYVGARSAMPNVRAPPAANLGIPSPELDV